MTNKKNILITGATGFVGAHLLKEIISHDDINKIYVLSRKITGRPDFDKDNFFQSIYKYLLTFSENEKDKIDIIFGDISQRKLGLANDCYNELSSSLDVIYHVAAEVNHVKNYEDLKKANVDSVVDIISLAENCKRKIINFVSTMAAASEKDYSGLYTEDFVGDTPVTLAMGYLKTKYEAEKILSNNRKNNSINIFRLGYISGSEKNGVSLYENNQLMLFIKSCIQLGFAPILTRNINLTPVDFTASVLGSYFFRKNSDQVLHLVNSSEYITWIELINFLNNFGYKIELIELSKWQDVLKKSGRENALYRMLLTYRRKDADEHIIRFGKNIHEYHINNIKDLSAREKIILPKIKYHYIEKIFKYLIDINFLPNPKSIDSGAI